MSAIITVVIALVLTWLALRFKSFALQAICALFWFRVAYLYMQGANKDTLLGIPMLLMGIWMLIDAIMTLRHTTQESDDDD